MLIHQEEKFLEDKEKLKQIVDKKYGQTLAHIQVDKGWITNDLEILKLVDINGNSVAHYQADKGWITNNPEILKLANIWGWTVAHVQSNHGWVTEDPEILNLSTSESGGLTVEYIQAKYRWATQELSPELEKVLISIGEKKFTEDKKILKSVVGDGLTIAHYQADAGWTTEDPEILKLTNIYGETVAHYQADNGWTTNDPEILKLANDNGNTVESYIKKYANKGEKNVEKN